MTSTTTSNSDLSYLGPKLVPQKTLPDFPPDPPTTCFVSRVELLQRLGRLLFHFIPDQDRDRGTLNNYQGRDGEGSLLLDQTVVKQTIDVRLSTSGRKVVLTELIPDSQPPPPGKLTHTKRNQRQQFILHLPFPIRATALRDNYHSEKVPLGHRTITISFDRVARSEAGEEDFKEPQCYEEMEELNDRINGLWDAGYFLNVKDILCAGCQLNVVSPGTESVPEELFSSNSTSPHTEKASVDLSGEDLSTVLSFTNEGLDSLEPSKQLQEEKVAEPLSQDITTTIQETMSQLDQLELSAEPNSVTPPTTGGEPTSYPEPPRPVRRTLFDRVRNLPNDGWEELLECWVCHSEDYTPQFQKLFHPSPTTLLVGATYILIHPTRLASYLQPQLSKGTPAPSTRLVCPACNTILGEMLTDAQSLSAVDGAPPKSYPSPSPPTTQLVVKLNKFSLLTNRVDPSTDLPSGDPPPPLPSSSLQSLPVAATLLSDLIGKYRYQSATRFILEDQDTHKPKILIMVLNWEVYLWDHALHPPPPSPPPSITTVTPAVRLCYLDLTPPPPPLIHTTEAALRYRLDNRHLLAAAWARDPTVATLPYPAPYLRAILDSFTLILPGLGPAHPLAGPLFQDGYLYLPTTTPSSSPSHPH